MMKLIDYIMSLLAKFEANVDFHRERGVIGARGDHHVQQQDML